VEEEKKVDPKLVTSPSLSKVVKMNKDDKRTDDTPSPLEKAGMRSSDDHLAPKLVEDTPMPDMHDMIETEYIKEEEPIILFQLNAEEKPLSKNTVGVSVNTVGKMFIAEKDELVHSKNHPVATGSQSISPSVNKEEPAKESVSRQTKKEELIKNSTTPVPAASGGYLARPSNIYAESKAEVNTSKPSVEEPVPSSYAANEEEELFDLQMQLVERDDIPAADMPMAHQAQPPLSTEAQDPALRDEAEEQTRRAAERLHKLRNLSFNVNGKDPNNEFENVPAYIRRNMELYNNSSHVENFYSSYEVRTDADNKTQISTINTFLDGQKPD
jgi:cell division protein FtsZ